MHKSKSQYNFNFNFFNKNKHRGVDLGGISTDDFNRVIFQWITAPPSQSKWSIPYNGCEVHAAFVFRKATSFNKNLNITNFDVVFTNLSDDLLSKLDNIYNATGKFCFFNESVGMVPFKFFDDQDIKRILAYLITLEELSSEEKEFLKMRGVVFGGLVFYSPLASKPLLLITDDIAFLYRIILLYANVYYNL